MADIELYMVAAMEVYKVADKVADVVADIVADMVVHKKNYNWPTCSWT